jgi:fructokinase
MVTRVGDDEDGRRALDLMETRGIDTSFVEVDGNHATGTVLVTLSGLDHTFTIRAPAAWDFIEGPGTLPHHDVFCYGSLAGRSNRSLGSLERLLETSEAFKCMDVNLRAGNEVNAALEIGFQHAAVVKAGGDEFGEVSRILDMDPSPPAWFDRHPRLEWIAVTRGDRGAELHARSGTHWKLAAEPVEVVDAVGAGDAFFAALVDGLVRGLDGGVALKIAQGAAAQIVRQRGAVPPMRRRKED